MPIENESEQLSPEDNIEEGSLDLSETNEKLDKLVDVIVGEIENKNKKEEEQKKLEEEEQKKLEEEEQKVTEEIEKEKEFTSSTVQTVLDNTAYLESINTLMQEQVFLTKLSFVGLGVGIALVSVLIFQNSFRR